MPDRSESRSPSPKRQRRSTTRSPQRRSASRSPQRRRRSPSRSPQRSPPQRSRRSPSRSPPRNRRRRSPSDDNPRRNDRRRSSRSPKRSCRDGSRSPLRQKRQEETEKPKVDEKKEAPKPISLKNRTGGAYIPPAKLKMLQEQIADKNSEEYQKMNWERLKKKIHGQVNKVNVGNLVSVVRELLQENIIRGKGLLTRSIIQAQAFSPTFSHVYAALVAVINSKFPHIGELVLRRLIIQFKRSFRRNDKTITVTVSKFIAHLINQQVAHEVLALEVLTLLLESPTDDSVEVAIAFLKECGAKLTEVTPRGINAIFDRLRSILHESKDLDKRVQYMIEVIFHVRKDKFAAYPSIVSELDLIEDDDQITHTITLDDDMKPENELNIFQLDKDFMKNEEIYEEIRKEIIGDPDASDDEEDDDADEDEEEPAAAASGEGQSTMTIIDNTEQNLVAFRRNVYLTIQSSLDYQEAAHKLLKMELKPGMEVELCNMIVDCCAQQRTYERFFGLLAERFCRLRREFQESFEKIARDTYNTIHRFDITKLRNMARFIGHLLFSDAITWDVLSEIKLNEDDTTSSSRIYIKILFQELSEFMGLATLYDRIRDPTMQSAFEKVFPRDNPRDTRFAINFFTSIGLGGLTVDLREHLKSGPKQLINLPSVPDEGKVKEEGSESSSSDDSSSDSSDSDESSSDSSSSSSSEEEKKKKKSRTKKKSSMRKSSPPARKSPPPVREKENRKKSSRSKGSPEPKSSPPPPEKESRKKSSRSKRTPEPESSPPRREKENRKKSSRSESPEPKSSPPPEKESRKKSSRSKRTPEPESSPPRREKENRKKSSRLKESPEPESSPPRREKENRKKSSRSEESPDRQRSKRR
uniref:Lethal protein 858 n=1 Tax=Plectus sambesii TaxID=2011161 RepID=A0A914WI86_9BILA